MARVLLSGLVSDIRGKLNGSVFKQSNAGLLLQNKPSSNRRVGKSSTELLGATSFDSGSALRANAVVRNAWSILSTTNRNTWLALVVSSPVKQKNSSDLFINGLQLFLKANTTRVMLGQNIILVPDFGVPLPAPISVILVNATAGMVVTLSRVILADELLIFSISARVRNTVNVAGSRLRLLNVTPDPILPTVDINTEYREKFGALPVAGEFLFTGVTVQNNNVGLSPTVRTQKCELF